MAYVKITLLLLAWLLGTVNSNLLALDPQKQITQYIHKKWTSDHGLPENNISDILQTSDGYLWIGTGSGLVRFDGVKFDVFNKSSIPGIPDNRITVLYETRMQWRFSTGRMQDCGWSNMVPHYQRRCFGEP
jgi:ligand-binding sensor domain-containing protein